MANVNVKFNNKDYLLSCDDGQEENLKKLAKQYKVSIERIRQIEDNAIKELRAKLKEA